MSNLATVNQATAALVSRTATKDGGYVLAVFMCISQTSVTTTCTSTQTTHSSEPQALPVSDELFTRFKSLMAAMAKTLPLFMVPSMFIPVDHMPLNSSAKVDRRALVKMLESVSESDPARYSLATSPAGRRQPSTPLETALHNLYSDILAIPTSSISVEDSFFHRGGNSITVMGLVSAARRVNVTLAVLDVFSHPTISELAKVARWTNPELAASQQRDSGNKHREDEAAKAEVLRLASEVYKMKGQQIQEIYPCTQLQDAMFALSQNHVGSYLLQIVTEISEDADLDGYLDAWKAVRRNNDILRTRIIHTKRRSYQVVYNDRMMIQHRSASTLDEYLDKDKKAPMHHGNALARFSFVTTDSSEQYFVCTLHHALYDGWSLRLIMDQIEQAC